MFSLRDFFFPLNPDFTWKQQQWPQGESSDITIHPEFSEHVSSHFSEPLYLLLPLPSFLVWLSSSPLQNSVLLSRFWKYFLTCLFPPFLVWRAAPTKCHHVTPQHSTYPHRSCPANFEDKGWVFLYLFPQYFALDLWVDIQEISADYK